MIIETEIFKTRLFTHLREGYIHVTSKSSFFKILKDENLISNETNEFTYPQSKNSVCYLLKGVSLFDFEQPDENLFRNANVDHFSEFFTIHKPITIIIKLDKSNLFNNTLSYQELKNRIKYKPLIPNVEVCYQGKIHIKNIFECIIVCGYEKNIFRILDKNNLNKNHVNKVEQLIKSEYNKNCGNDIRNRLSQGIKTFTDIHYHKVYEDIIKWLDY